MNGQNKTRTSQERIESLGIPKPQFVQWWNDGDKSDLAIRVAISLFAAIALLTICLTWRPRFAFRSGDIPMRDLIARVNFEVENEIETEANRLDQIRTVPVFYRNRPGILDQLLSRLKNRMLVIQDTPSLKEMSDEERKVFEEFSSLEPLTPESAKENATTATDRFAAMKAILESDESLDSVTTAFKMLTKTDFRNGLLQAFKHEQEQGSQSDIRVYVNSPDESEYVKLDDVQIGFMQPKVEKTLAEEFRRLFDGKVDRDQARLAATVVSEWIDRQLPEYETLTYDDDASERARVEIAAKVPPVMKKFYAGQSKLAEAGDPLDEDELQLLRQEHYQWSGLLGDYDRLARITAYGGMVAALYLLCGSYILFVDDRTLVLDRVKLSKLLCFMVATIGAAYWCAADQYRSELAPLVVASIIAAIVYGRDLALLLMSAACISTTLFLNESLAHLVMLAAACTSCTLVTGRIRTASHLLFVGGVSAAVTLLTIIGVGIVTGQTLTLHAESANLVQDTLPTSNSFATVLWQLIKEALKAGVFIIVSAAALTPFLRLVEKTFGVQTDLSLLGLSDPSHPLLRRLAQRAPGTYNHSINVASIGEAAADAIGANGLLVRVGAYFHDIGKMFKPEYFIENQSGVNQHDSLQPAMSTLVIIAHVKDGADLARNHHLPQPLIDLIMQHHGTTLVEYFFNEAAKRSEENPNEKEVKDKDFRYPGPKPQTLEAAVMMLADTVESASRTLVDPTPARIQNLVDKIAQKKMADGQFDECGLTFRQLNLVRKSLVKSLTAIYHARVKYPSNLPA